MPSPALRHDTLAPTALTEGVHPLAVPVDTYDPGPRITVSHQHHVPTGLRYLSSPIEEKKTDRAALVLRASLGQNSLGNPGMTRSMARGLVHHDHLEGTGLREVRLTKPSSVTMLAGRLARVTFPIEILLLESWGHRGYAIAHVEDLVVFEP